MGSHSTNRPPHRQGGNFRAEILLDDSHELLAVLVGVNALVQREVLQRFVMNPLEEVVDGPTRRRLEVLHGVLEPGEYEVRQETRGGTIEVETKG